MTVLTLKALKAQSRYDIPAYTNGWFQIGWSKELKAGQLRKVKHFGRSFTLFRGEDGQLGLVGDVCPHLGAHFSEGGRVKGNAVQCPYHNWSFGKNGKCTHIPYSKLIPPKARVDAHKVVERHGMIFMFRHSNPGAPAHDLPEIEDFDESRYLDPAKRSFKVRIHGQDIMENSVDSAHFAAVHGHAMPVNTFRAEGSKLRVTQASSVARFGTHLKFRIEFHLVEPGFHFVHFPELPFTQAVLLSSIVPVDEEYTEHRMTIWIRKSKVPFLSALIKRFIVWQMMKTYREDMRIWESKEYHSQPVLCDGDGSILLLRRWYAQFFDQPAQAKAA